MLSKTIQKRFFTALEKIEKGSLTLHCPDGRPYFFEGSEPGVAAEIEIRSWSVVSNLVFKGEVGFAEDFRDGLWDTGDLERLIHFALINEGSLDSYINGGRWARTLAQLSYLFNLNSLRGSRRNIHAHYDLGNAFYSLWLDPTMTYSSALYQGVGDSMVVAQLNKYDRLIDRIEVEAGSLLEIGCGWGGFAERALEKGDFELRGITLSTEQLNYARRRLGKYARFELEDYRRIQGKFDNIVSIEMFEAVGIRYWKKYFEQISQLLKRGGKALIQSIVIEDSRFDSYRHGSDVIRSFIFPGGMLPSLERFRRSAEREGLETTNTFLFGQHYARTLREWLRNFDAALPEVRRLGFDEPFIRIWRYYLASCAASFAEGRINVGQMELRHA